MKRIFFQKFKLLFLIFIFLIIFIISYLIYINQNNQVDASSNEVLDIEKSTLPTIETKNTIKVDIKGLVANPGVYELDEGSRVIDAINLSGGLIDEAITDNINLSKKLKDENVIIISKRQELKEPEKVIEYKYIYQECECPKINDVCVKKNDIVNEISDTESNKQDNNEESKVNDLISINNGTSEELQSLPGIGESKAIAIIKYREENGLYQKIEDIMNVTGIGNALFEKIKEFITI